MDTDTKIRLLDFDSRTLREFSQNEIVIKSVQNQFGQMSYRNAQILLRQIINGSNSISTKSFPKGGSRIYQYNKSKFDKPEDGFKNVFLLKETTKRELILELDILLKTMVEEDELDNKDTELDEDILVPQETNGSLVVKVDRNTYYEKIRKIICSDNQTYFKYNFSKPDLKVYPPNNNLSLQRCNIHIVSLPIIFHYPTEYKYHCSQCNHDMSMYPYEVTSTNDKVKCTGTITNPNTGNISQCKTSLSPDAEICVTNEAYYYDINYEDIHGKKHPASAVSFVHLEPGFYNCVLFSLRGVKKTNSFHIIDVEEIKSNKFLVPKHNNNEHFITTLIKAFDNYIKEQSGVDIYGLYPIKMALIIQKLYSVFGYKLSGNIQLVGDPSTGKSLILKYYGFLLNTTFNLSTNGLSISVPGLRGSFHSINILGKDTRVVTTGHLGTYTSIHIDEAGENKELIQNLKPFLLDENYSYDKAGGAGISNRRTAHVNISENLDHSHMGQYRGAIRKAYKDITYKIGDMEKENWDENWDLHLPMFMYENPYLRKVIKEKRLEYMQKQTFWIDGYEYALHERFPFYFYLVTTKRDTKLSSIIRENQRRNTISENIELIRALKSDDIKNYFGTLKQIENINDQHDEAFQKVDDIIDLYGFNFDVRMKSFYYQLVKTCRMVNNQDNYTEHDFDILRYFLENTNRKIDVADTNNFTLTGPPDLSKEEKIDQKIEDTTKGGDDFGIADGEFDEL